jgi:hypothetical protein
MRDDLAARVADKMSEFLGRPVSPLVVYAARDAFEAVGYAVVPRESIEGVIHSAKNTPSPSANFANSIDDLYYALHPPAKKDAADAG